MITADRGHRFRGRRGDAGQALVVVVLALVAMLGMVALVIDGGNAYAQQRATQNGTDAVAEAGAVVLAERLAGGTPTDADVLAAVNDMAALNEVTVTSAVYTDVLGASIGIAVGSTGGAIPTAASGVQANGDRVFDSFIARVIGISSFQASTRATAVAGYKKTTCDSAEGCVLLPITPPILATTCDGTNRPVVVPPGQEWTKDVVTIVPLCQTGAGNVGWIDWFPPDGGTSDTIDSVNDPDNPAITFPTWIEISQTGNTNSTGLEDAINQYKGQPVVLPIFSHTCGDDPVGPLDDVASCQANLDNGQGAKMWYYLEGTRSLLLCAQGIPSCDSHTPPAIQGAYLSGSPLICDTGNGATGCLIGLFKDASVSPGAVDPDYSGSGGTSSNRELTVQLIR